MVELTRPWMSPARLVALLRVIAMIGVLAPGIASAMEVLWDNLDPADHRGLLFDADVQGNTIVASGESCDVLGVCGLLVRAYDRQSGNILWEDRLVDLLWSPGNEVSADAARVVVAGWSLRGLPSGFVFIVRTYDLRTGELLWSREIDRSERDVAKVVAIHGGQVYVGGHTWNSAGANSDYALLAFDVATGATLWEHISDFHGLGQSDYAWSIVTAGNRVLVAGEARGRSSMLVRSHSAATGDILWESEIPGAYNFAEEHCIGVRGNLLFVCGGMFGPGDTDDMFVRAYDLSSGEIHWTDRVDDDGRLSQAIALTLSAGQLFVIGYYACSPTNFDECRLALRAYEPDTGALRWGQVHESPGNDWFVNAVAAGAGSVFVAGAQLNAALDYESTIVAYAAATGEQEWEDRTDDGGGPMLATEAFRLVVRQGRLIAAGKFWSGQAGGSLPWVRVYSINP